jgi:L-lactate dehydrogenase (cytochrome)
MMHFRRALNVDDMRALARRRLPRGIFEYVDRGTEDEVSLRANRQALDDLKLQPSILVDVSERHQEVEIFGRSQPTPLVIAPTAAAGLMWHNGEIHLARAAAAAGIPFCVSTQSITAIEKIAETGARLWFQLYVWRDRALTYKLIERARAAGAEALVLTADTVVSPKREYNQRNGFGIPLKPSLCGALDVASHPRWLWSVLLRYLRTEGMPVYAHYPSDLRTAITSVAASSALGLSDMMTWDDLLELRRRWPGRLIVKGILRADDALKAAECGVDGIVVSNHGGRNLDIAPSPVDVLPRIAETVGSRLTILADSGVRRGSDVVKYLALGAEAVLIGRSVLFGVAAGGEAGATHVLHSLKHEIDNTLALLGCRSITELRDCEHSRSRRK